MADMGILKRSCRAPTLILKDNERNAEQGGSRTGRGRGVRRNEDSCQRRDDETTDPLGQISMSRPVRPPPCGPSLNNTPSSPRRQIADGLERQAQFQSKGRGGGRRRQSATRARAGPVKRREGVGYDERRTCGSRRAETYEHVERDDGRKHALQGPVARQSPLWLRSDAICRPGASGASTLARLIGGSVEQFGLL